MTEKKETLMTTTVCLGEDEKNLAKTEKFRLRNAPLRNKKKKQKNKSPVRFGFNQNLTPESFRILPTCLESFGAAVAYWLERRIRDRNEDFERAFDSPLTHTLSKVRDAQ